jgi:hypothetical protein
VVHVEVAPGNILVVAAWMLDAAACAGMELGMPRVTMAALAELHQLLVEHGFRRRFLDGPTIVQGKQREDPADINAVIGRPAAAQHPVRFDKAAGHDPCGAPNLACQAGPPAARGRRRHRRGEW